MSTIKSSAENLTLNADGANNDIKFQSNGSEVAQIDQAGVISSTGGSTHADNIKDKFGTGNDLEIFHDGTHSYIKDVGTGDLRLMGTNLSLRSESTNEPYLNATENGAVDLFHNNVKKFETTATGVTIAGTVASIISANNAQGEIAFGDPEDANIGRIAYNHPSNFLATVVNATEYMRIHSNGVTSIPSGVALGVGTANTASNVLDDYEEGTWTPTASTDSNGVTVNSALYTKIGKVVNWQFYIVISPNQNNNGDDFYIGGFPFTASASNGYWGATFSYVTAVNIATNHWLPIVQTNGTYMSFHRGDGSGARVTNAQGYGVTGLIMSGSFMTT